MSLFKPKDTVYLKETGEKVVIKTKITNYGSRNTMYTLEDGRIAYAFDLVAKKPKKVTELKQTSKESNKKITKEEKPIKKRSGKNSEKENSGE